MATSERVLRVFVAAPSDVEREVNALRRIVEKLNQNHGKYLGVQVRVVNWKTDVIPAMGSDPEAVILDQINDDAYDVFVGILWTRFGTPTPRAGSGTEEEFRRAYEKYGAAPNSLRIMMYFSNVPAPPLSVDLEQLANVRKFRDEIRERGIFTNINNRKEFDDLAEKHLAALMHTWKPERLRVPTIANPVTSKWAKFVLSRKRVPFRHLQDADFAVRRISREMTGFRLKIEIPEKVYWRAGFILAPEDYVHEGRADISMTQYFLFHIGRGESSDPKKKIGLHYQAYYQNEPLTARLPFVASGTVELEVAFDAKHHRLAVGFADVDYDHEIEPRYWQYLYALAWADWFDEFRVPIELKSASQQKGRP